MADLALQERGRAWSRLRATPARLLTRDRLLIIGVLIAFLALWEGLVVLLNVESIFLPAPSAIAAKLYAGLAQPLLSREGLWVHAAYTVTEALGGFLIGSAAGIFFGILIAQWRILDVVLRPYMVAFQSLPKVAMAPLIVVWLGFGMFSKVIITSLLTFFPLLINTYTGLKGADPDRVDLMRGMAATKSQIFRKVSFPGALPYVFAGLEMAIVFSMVGAIVGEFVGAQRGLGVLILQRNFSLDVAGAFAVFIVLSVIGVILSAIVNRIRDRVVFWEPSEHRNIGT